MQTSPNWNTTPPEYKAMITAANSWGPGTDPERQWFLRGWIDERDSDLSPPSGNAETNAAPWAAYNSGRVAYRGY